MIQRFFVWLMNEQEKRKALFVKKKKIADPGWLVLYVMMMSVELRV